MVNISNSIIEWLSGYLKDSITTDRLMPDSVSYGLFKAPTQNVKKDILGNVTYSDFHVFMARLDNVTNKNMQANQDFMQGLCDWIEEQNNKKNFPLLGTYKCKSIEVSTPFYMGQNEDTSSIYQFTINIVYRKEN